MIKWLAQLFQRKLRTGPNSRVRHSERSVVVLNSGTKTQRTI